MFKSSILYTIFIINEHGIYLNPSIRADGAVFPCCISEYCENMIVGDLSKEKFAHIWNSEKYKKFRDGFINGNNEICNRCYLKYSPIPIFKNKHFILGSKMNVKLGIQRLLKHFFVLDFYFSKNRLFKIWVKFRLRRKLETD